MRQHGVTANTYREMMIDAGAVYKNFDLPTELLLGATRGGTSFSIETEIREMPVDGAKGPVMGGRRITKVVAKIKANFVAFSKELLLLVNPGAAATDYPAGTPTHDSFKRALGLVLADYCENITIVGNVSGTSNPVRYIIFNALADGKFELGFTDNDEAVAAVEFTGHYAPNAPDDDPWEIQYPKIADTTTTTTAGA